MLLFSPLQSWAPCCLTPLAVSQNKPEQQRQLSWVQGEQPGAMPVPSVLGLSGASSESSHSDLGPDS